MSSHPTSSLPVSPSPSSSSTKNQQNASQQLSSSSMGKDVQLLLVVDEIASSLHQDELDLIDDLSLAAADTGSDHDHDEKSQWADSEVYLRFCIHMLTAMCHYTLLPY